MRISMIAAMAKNRVIGLNNDLPWHLPDDFTFFKSTTKHHPVIMGRKNFESLPPKFKPLPDRTNIILTRNNDYKADGAYVFSEWKEALDYALTEKKDEIFIIGGGEIYKQGLVFADRIYLTEINAEIDGDTFFPEFDKRIWVENVRKHHPQDDRHRYSFDFVIYDKV